MVLRWIPACVRADPAPCTRGDSPDVTAGSERGDACSPHPRGWSYRGLRAVGRAPSAPRTRGDGPAHRMPTGADVRCSPHPRGWSPRPEHGVARSRAPRTRGDGPSTPSLSMSASRCSPHPRGWSRHLSGLAITVICSSGADTAAGLPGSHTATRSTTARVGAMQAIRSPKDATPGHRERVNSQARSPQAKLYTGK